MRTTYLVPGARGRGLGLVAGLALLCLAGTMMSSSPARAADAPSAESGILTIGDGYAQAHGSTRVRALQQRLRTLGLRPGPVDGLFGPATRAAVESFERSVGLGVDGMVGVQTRRALRRASAPFLGLGAGYNERGGSLQVRRLQRQLRRLGLRPGPIDGLYGPRTAAAVARFQHARRAMADGVAWFGTRRAIATAGRRVTRRLIRNRLAPRTLAPVTAPVVTSPAPLVTTPAADKESRSTSRILAIGALAFALAALATPFGRRLALAGASALARRGEGTPADREAVKGVGPGEAIGYVRPTDARIGWLEARWQITAMDAICDRLGLRLVQVAHDGDDASGAPSDSPGLRHALERLAASDTRCLVVAEIRALGDSTVELGHMLQSLRDRGVRLVAVDVELDTAAGHEQGRRDGRAKGTASARRPGRRAVRDLPGLQQHIVAMRSAGMTLQAIADRLNREGVPTVRGGREWRPSSVQVAAGYRRPRRLSASRGVGPEAARLGRTEDP